MTVLIFTLGSHGDVHPFVGIGLELRRRGHDVTLITNGHFEDLARAAGLDFAPVGSDEQYRALMNDPDLWHKYRGFDAVFCKAVLPTLEQAYETIAARIAPRETVLVANSLGFAARIVQDKLGIPLATVHIQPAVLRTVHDVPKLPGLFMPRWMPIWMRRWVWDGGDKYYIDPKLCPKINEFRAKLGLEPACGIINTWWNSPQRVIGLWPGWYAPVQPDWPEQLRIVGFPLYDESDISPLPQDLCDWLDSGEAPIAFTAGSAMAQGERFFSQAVAACQRLNRRGLLLTRHTGQLPYPLPRNVRHCSYAPFGKLLPRCAALVHHGGIGTTSQALRAGIPQIIMPMSHDQFDNAYRVSRLGVGIEIPRSRFKAPLIARRLRQLLTRPEVAENCREIARRFDTDDALRRTADLVEQLAPASETASAPQ